MSLVWRRKDNYHLATECGRFSISKVIVRGAISYIAWRRGNPSKEIGVTRLEPDATEQERAETVGALKALCEAANEFAQPG